MTTWRDLFLSLWAGSDAPAIITASQTWSGSELVTRAGGASRWLDRLDAPTGLAVPALVDESAPAIALAVGAAISARPLAPLGTKLPPSELAAAVVGLGAPVLIADAEWADKAAAVAELAGARLHLLPTMDTDGPIPDVAPNESDTAVVIHTSGTTGAPKPVFQRNRPLVARVGVYGPAIELVPGSVYSSASPFYHVAGAGMTFVALGAGAAIIPCPWFSLDAWREVQTLGPTHALLVPTMIDILLAEGLLDVGLDVIQYGAAPIHPDTLAEAIRSLPRTRMVQIFGQTEVSPITLMTHEEHLEAIAGRPELLRSVGRAVPGSDLVVEDPDESGVGEIAIRAAHAFTTDSDGWRRSGDLGRIASDGYVTLHGRRNDRIVRGGENIYPLEIETVLASHPAITEVCVLGIPDRRWGEIVRAVVVVAPGAEPPTPSELQTYAREHLAGFKVPAVVDYIDELPRTPSGKVLRRDL